MKHKFSLTERLTSEEDPTSALNNAVEQLQTDITAPFVKVSKSTLGGINRATVMIIISLQPKEEWPSGILQNSDYAHISLQMDTGKLEMFSGSIRPAMRKTTCPDVLTAVYAINRWISKVNVDHGEE